MPARPPEGHSPPLAGVRVTCRREEAGIEQVRVCGGDVCGRGVQRATTLHQCLFGQTLGYVVAGQLLGGLVIDRLGWFGLQSVGLSWARLLGGVFLLAGVILMTRR